MYRKKENLRNISLFVTFIFIIVCLIISTTICGFSKEKYLIGFSNLEFCHSWRSGLNEALTNEVNKYQDMEIVITDAQTSVDKQIADIEDLITKGVDLLIVSPVKGEPLRGILDTVKDAGLPMILFDRYIPGWENYDNVHFIHTSNYDLGLVSAFYSVKLLIDKYGEPKGKIVQIEGLAGSTPAILRKEAFEKIISYFPDIEIVASQPTNWSRKEGIDVTENLMLAHPDTDLIYNHCDTSGVGTVIALENMGLAGDVFVVCASDAFQESIKYILEGKMHMVNFYGWGAREIINSARKVLAGEEAPKEILLPTKTFTAGNAEDYYNPNEVFATTKK